MAAARGLEPLNPALARDTYLDALSAALVAGRLAPRPAVRRLVEAVREAPRPDAPGRGDALLGGLTVLFTDGYVQAAPTARRAVQAFVRRGPAP